MSVNMDSYGVNPVNYGAYMVSYGINSVNYGAYMDSYGVNPVSYGAYMASYGGYMVNYGGYTDRCHFYIKNCQVGFLGDWKDRIEEVWNTCVAFFSKNNDFEKFSKC